MLSDGMSRRRMIVGAGGAAAAAGAALAWNMSPAAADEASSVSEEKHRSSIVGTWLLTHTDEPTKSTPNPEPGVATISFVPSGIVIIHEVNPPAPPGQGTWARTGHDGFIFSFLSSGQQPPPPGGGPPLVYIVSVTAKGTVHDGEMSGNYEFTVTDGNTPPAPLDHGTGTFTATPYPANGQVS
jgi:hypothetical protein